MDQLLDEWASDWKLAGRAVATMRSYQYVIRPLLASHQTLTLALVKGWVADATTIDIRRWRGRVARAFCKWATAEGIADYSSWQRIPLATVPETPQPTVTPDEALAVIGRCRNIRDRALVAVLWASGMRVGEVCRMRIEDLDLANGCVVVPQTKSRRPRIAPLDERVRKALYRLLRLDRRTSGPLWIGPKGPLTILGSPPDTAPSRCPHCPLMEAWLGGPLAALRHLPGVGAGGWRLGSQRGDDRPVHQGDVVGAIDRPSSANAGRADDCLRPPRLWAVNDPYALVRQVVRRHSRGTLTPHSVRRYFACSWLSRGGSETSLMRIAGWSSLAMTRTYVQAQADVIAADEFKRLMA